MNEENGIKTVNIKCGKDTLNYTLQHPGIRWYLETTDKHMLPIGVAHQSQLISSYLEHVVVKPAGLTLDAFDKDKGKTKMITVGDQKLTLVMPSLKVRLDESCFNRNSNGTVSVTKETDWYLDNCIQEDVKLEDIGGLKNIQTIISEGKSFLQDSKSFQLIYDLIIEVDTFLSR